MIALYPHQEQMVRETLQALSKHRSVLVSAPTGTGKSVVGAALVKHFGRSLYLAHRIELVQQFAFMASRQGVMADVEHGSERAMEEADCVCGTVQTFSQPDRLRGWPRGHFECVLVDEAHHAYCRTYRRVIDWFSDAKVVGLTATPFRRKKKENLGAVFETYASVLTLPDALDGGWLVPATGLTIHVNSLDISRVDSQGGDLDTVTLERVMSEEGVLHGVARPLLEHCVGRTIVFAAGIHHAERLAEVLNRYQPGCADVLHSEQHSSVRARVLQQHKEGAFPILVNVGIATEGYDDPYVRCIGIARPTKSLLLYCQMVGRGLRPLPGVIDGAASAADRKAAIAGSEKPSVLILDWSGQAGKHRLVTLPDLVCSDDNLLSEVAADVMRQAKGAVSVTAAVEQAGVLLNLLDPVLRSTIHAAVKYRAKAFFPLRVAGIQYDAGDTGVRWARLDPMPPWLAQRLREHGVQPLGMSREEGLRLLEWLESRRRAGLASWRQLRLLVPRGFPADLTKAQASAIIGDLEAHRWQWTRFSPQRLPGSWPASAGHMRG